MTLISASLGSCPDRITLAMNDLELRMSLHRVARDGNVADLRELGVSCLKLDVVNRHAARKCGVLTVVDEIEVYLAYQTGLRERLQLPVPSQNMLFGSCSGVTSTDIEAAYQEATAQANNPAAVEEYLRSWEPWQRPRRAAQANSSVYQDLPDFTVRDAQINDAVCVFTQESWTQLEQPVYYYIHNTLYVYEYEPLMRWWIEHGTDPTITTHRIKMDDWIRPSR